MTADRAAELWRRILEIAAEFHAGALEADFMAAYTPVPVSGRVPITIPDGTAISRDAATGWLESCGIKSRLLFAGEISREHTYHGAPYRMVGDPKTAHRMTRHPPDRCLSWTRLARAGLCRAPVVAGAAEHLLLRTTGLRWSRLLATAWERRA